MPSYYGPDSVFLQDWNEATGLTEAYGIAIVPSCGDVLYLSIEARVEGSRLITRSPKRRPAATQWVRPRKSDRPLSSSEWITIVAGVDAMGFWKLPSAVGNNQLLDGVMIVIEGYKGTTQHSVRWFNPDEGDRIIELINTVFRLAPIQTRAVGC